jgi:membrane protease YdiL (CAAX protease family)
MTESTPGFSNVLILGLLSFHILWMGKKRNFFVFSTSPWKVPLNLGHVLSAFFIYFGVSTFITPLIGKLLQSILFATPSASAFLQYASWINFINSALILCSLGAICFWSPNPVKQGIWFRNKETKHHLGPSFLTAGFAWILSFPLVLFTNQLFDWLISSLFHVVQMPEQLAVYFLKMTFGHPLYFTLAVLTIIVFAPIIEEMLFRGFLQSWIRQHLGSKQAILVTSLLFAFFHYSPEQGIANITIISSLFVFSLFIGFVYEREGALASPIMLHSLFNTINVCNLYFFGGIFDRSLQIHL